MRMVFLALAVHLGGGRDDHAAGDRWFAADKAKHFFASAFVQSASYSILRIAKAPHAEALAGASALTLGIGIGKELTDARHGGAPSAKDMTWNVAGLAAATALLSATKRH